MKLTRTGPLFKEIDVSETSKDPFEKFLLDPPADTVESLRALCERTSEQNYDRESALRAELYATHGWPPALIKAAEDDFTYTAWIDGIGAVEFESAKLLPFGWVHLVGPKPCDLAGSDPRFASHWRRGLDVRLSAIKWVADGGH